MEEKCLNFQCQQKRIVTKLIYDQLPTRFQTAHVDVDNTEHTTEFAAIAFEVYSSKK